MTIRYLLALCMAFLAAACVPRPDMVIESGDRFTTEASVAMEDYRLGVGDKIRMTVFREPTLSGEFAVTPNGTLSLPLIGDVNAMDKTASEVGKTVQEMLGAGYLKEPRVNVEVTTYRPFFILGEVKAPGQYPYATAMTVLNAVATAQGFTPRAQKTTVYIRRSGAAAEEAYKLSPDLRIMPGDTIRVGERYF